MTIADRLPPHPPLTTFTVFAGCAWAAGVACCALDWRPRRRWRLRQPGRPRRTPPMPDPFTRFRITGPPVTPPRRRREVAALLHRGLETRTASEGPSHARDGFDRVDEGPIWRGVREVLHQRLSRMHWANRRAASCCSWRASSCVPVNPGGSRSLHALHGLHCLPRPRAMPGFQRRAVLVPPIDGRAGARHVPGPGTSLTAVVCACTRRTSPPCPEWWSCCCQTACICWC